MASNRSNQPRTPQKRVNDAIDQSKALLSQLKHTQTLMEAAAFSVIGEQNIQAYRSKSGAVLNGIRTSVRLADNLRMELAGSANDLKREISMLKRSREQLQHELASANSRLKEYEFLDQQLTENFSDEESTPEKKAKVDVKDENTPHEPELQNNKKDTDLIDNDPNKAETTGQSGVVDNTKNNAAATSMKEEQAGNN